MTDQLGPFLLAPAEAGLFLDFDGTLSEIVRLPHEARPLDGVVEVLDRLGRRFGAVVIVSGRGAGQLVEWLGPSVEIWGVHGAERAVEGSVVLSDTAVPHAELMRRVYREAAAEVERLGLDGVILEDKGVMIGLHFRAATDQSAARRALDRLVADLSERHGLDRAGGRLAYELRAPADFSKAAVVLDRARALGLRAVAFMGDDRVDLPGFDALDELAEEGVATLRVAVDSDEAPPVLLKRADVVVSGPSGALRFLESLLD
ncbi:MAG: trehalose-phosphatase [Actinomycetota bacterium]